MTTHYIHHRIECRPRQWASSAEQLARQGAGPLAEAGGSLYGIWRSQIGRPRDELTVLTSGLEGTAISRVGKVLQATVGDAVGIESEGMAPTLRPADPAPPTRQGNYAFRWFELAESSWPEFLELCAGAWPGFEAAYDSQVIGLWRMHEASPGRVRSLLLTRRPSLAMWERSKLPEGAREAEVRQKLSRRYDLCDWTQVYTTTLLSASDRRDTARWT